MATDAWILGAPLRVLRQSDHPYHETTLATLARHEICLVRRQAPQDAGSELILDGHTIYQPGATALHRAWFDVCRELGYAPAHHWDWDPALILFQQVMPALAADWHEPPMPLDPQGLPEGILSLADLRLAFATAVGGLRDRSAGPVEAKVAETFEWLPLRAVVFHDEAQTALDFEGRGPCCRVSLWLAIHRDRPVVLRRRTPDQPGPGPWGPSALEERLPAETFLAAAGLDPEVPKGFEAALDAALAHLFQELEAPLEAYRRTYPVGIPWHHTRRERLLGRTIVDVRAGHPPMLLLDDGTEVAIDPNPVPYTEERGI